MSELIGSAELEIGVDLAPLDRGLKDAEAKVAAEMAVIQKMLDRHMDVSSGKLSMLSGATERGILGSLGKLRQTTDDVASGLVGAWGRVADSQATIRASLAETAAVATATADVQVAAADRVTAAYLEEAAAARAAAEAHSALIGRGVAADVAGLATGHATRSRAGAGGLATLAGIEGIRGLAHPGSRSNPLVVVLEAARYTSLGALGAAVGENSMTGGPVAGAGSKSDGGQGPVILDQHGRPLAAGFTSADSRKRAVTEDALAAATAKLADAMAHQGGGGPTVAASAPRAAASKQAPIPVIVQDKSTTASSKDSEALLAALAAKGRTGRELQPAQMASSGLAAYYAAHGFASALAPDGRMRLYGPGGAPGTHSFGASPLATGAGAGVGAGGGGGGGGGIPPWLAGLLWSHGGAGGGGGGGRRLPGFAGAAIAGGLGIGAGVGTLGSFAGFGAEHILLTGGGIVGSGISALAGGGLLGAGALGKLGVGGGSNAAVLKSTIADTKQIGEAYKNLERAVAVYGKNSEQAARAQKELNFLLEELGNTAGVKAEKQLAKAGDALNQFWDKQTSGARVQASHLLMQVLEVGHSYVPLVAHAAEQNLQITNKTIKPLFAWLRGPEGMGIFLQLEREFKNQIPTAMHALNQGFQLFAKTVAYTAPLTGRFLVELDHFFTRWNSPGQFTVWEGEINNLVHDFRVWSAFVKILGKDLFDLFHRDAHTGQGIIETLTQMLVRLNEWEKSTKGSHAIENIFLVHKEEVIALLKLLPPLISGFSGIYTTVAPPLVKAVTGIAEAFAWLLNTIDQAGPLGRWALGLTLIAAKLGVLKPLLTAIRGEFTGVAAAETANAAAAGADAAATGALGGAEAIALANGGGVMLKGASGLSAAERGNLAANAAGAGALSAKSLALRGGAAAGAGLLGGSLLAGATGAKGTLGTAISTAGAGAGAGFVLGPAAGAALGTEVAPIVGTAIGAGLGFAAPYVVKFLSGVFSAHAPDYGKKFAAGFVGPLEANLGRATAQAYGKALDKAQNAVVEARRGLTQPVSAATGVRGSGAVSAARQHGQSAANLVAAEHHLGELASKAFIEGQQHVRFPTRSVLQQSMLDSLAQLPPQARGAAAKAMLAYASELEHKGTLAKGAVATMIKSLEGQFPGLQAYLAQHGAALASQFAKTLELRQARSTLANTLTSISQQFGTSSTDTIANATQTMSELEYVVAHSKGPLQHAAAEAFGALRAAVVHQLTLTRGSAGDLVGEMNARVTLGMETLAQGISTINKELEGELSALGAGKEVKVALVHGHGGLNLKGSPFEGKAGGGLVQIGNPGEGGHDTVPLNVGGMPIAVGAGEVVAVFNRHQLPEVNGALADRGYAGLPGLFSSVNTPNYMASGGFVPGPGTNYSVGQEPQIAADLRRLGEYVHVMLVGISGYRSPSHSVAVGGFSNDPHTRGEASDTIGTQNIPESVLERFGLTRPFPGAAEADHMQLLGGHKGSGIGGAVAAAFGAASRSVAKIKTPHAKGRGPVTRIVQSALSKATAAANRKLAAVAPAMGGGSPSGGRSAGNAQMRAWAKAGLIAAGLPGTPAEVSTIVYTMSRESGGNPRSENTTDSNAAAGHPSRGLMELIPENFAKYHVPGTSSDVFDPVANVAAAVRYMIGRYGHIVGMSPYARGGLVRRFAGGGLASGRGRLGFGKGGTVPPRAKKIPKQSWKVHGFGRIPKLSTSWWGQGFYDQLGGLMGNTGQVAVQSENYELANRAAEMALARSPHEGAFVVTPNSALGETGSPYIDEGNVNLRRGQIGSLEHIESGLYASLEEAWHLSQRTLESFVSSIAERRKAVEALRARIRKNIEDIKKAQEAIKRLTAERKKVKHGSAQEKRLTASIKAENDKIGVLHAENQRLGGSPDSIGTGGNIGLLLNQVDDLKKGEETVHGYAQTIAGVSGHGGERQQTADTLSELAKQMTEIGGTALAVKLAEAGGGPESHSELVEREKAQLEEKLKIKTEENRTNEAALKVFGGPGDIGRGGVNAFAAAAFGSRGMLLPYGGSFADGGIVPGAIGSAKAAVVHGGEKITKVGGGDYNGPEVIVEQNIHTLHPGDPAHLTAVGKAAVRGIRYQGLRQAKRVRLGI